MSYWVIERRLRKGGKAALGTPAIGEDLIGAVTHDDCDGLPPHGLATIWRFHDKETADALCELLSDKLPEGKEFARNGAGWTREDECFWGAVEVKE